MDGMTGLGSIPNRVKLPSLAFFVIIFSATIATGEDAPKIKMLSPASGTSEVSVETKEIVVTFDRPMDTRGYSYTGGGASFPKTNGKPFWRSETECVLPVILEPGMEYRFGFNNAKFRDFKSKEGVALDPVMYQISTSKVAPPAGKAISPGERLKSAVQNHYSYRDLRKVDWEKLWTEYDEKLENAKKPEDFAAVASEALSVTKDPHIWFQVGGKTVAGVGRNAKPNGNFQELPSVVEDFMRVNPMVATGTVDKDISYLAILNLSGSPGAPNMEPAYVALAEAKEKNGLILDLRFNAGGNELLAREIAGCFITEKKLYAKHANPGIQERWAEPNPDRPSYRGKVAVLTGPYVMSSAEGFLLMMRQAPDVKLIGEKSFGSSGYPKPHDLGNGVTVFLPSWKAMLPDETIFEGIGIKPDIVVPTAPNDFTKGKDPVIDAAIRWLKK